MADCIFCSVVKQDPQNKITENDSFLALLDMNPVSPGHSIILPKRHMESYFDLSDVEMIRLQNIIVSVRKMINENSKDKPAGFNIGVNEGEAAGATQKHLLVHMIPRYKGDVPNPAGGIRNILAMPEMPIMQAPKEEKKPEPKPEPKPVVKEEKKPVKPKTWQDLLEENKKKQKEVERTTVRNKFK